MSTLIPSSLNFAEMMLEAIAVGCLIAGGMWLISEIVLLIFERFGK